MWKFGKLPDPKIVGKKKGAKKPLLDLCEDWHADNYSGNLSLLQSLLGPTLQTKSG